MGEVVIMEKFTWSKVLTGSKKVRIAICAIAFCATVVIAAVFCTQNKKIESMQAEIKELKEYKSVALSMKNQIEESTAKMEELQNQIDNLSGKSVFKVRVDDGEGGYVVKNPDGTSSSFNSLYGASEPKK